MIASLKTISFATLAGLLPVLTSAVEFIELGGTQIQFNGTSTGCVTVADGQASNGTAVEIAQCANSSLSGNLAPLQLWTIYRDLPGAIKLTNSVDNLCLYTTSNGTTDAGAIEVRTCSYDQNNTATVGFNWYFTDDGHIAQTGGNQCLDVVQGSNATDEPGSLQTLQTWACSGSDIEQFYTL